MDEKSGSSTLQHEGDLPQPHPSLRESLMRRVTPHFLPQVGQQTDQGSGQHRPENPRTTSQPIVEGLLQHLSYRPQAQANTEFPEEKPVTHDDKLTDFRRLVGIDSSPSHTLSSGYHRAAENVGIYTHVVQEEAACMAKYKRYSILINSSLGLQLIFAAALTALGAGDGPRSAVTAFGAINTVLAGILTFLKGSGLPNREKYYAGEWRKVRDHIEQREREFGRYGCNLDVDAEMRNIEGMYHEVKQDVEVNTPDGFTSVTAKRLIGNTGPQTAADLPGTRSPGALEAGYPNTISPTTGTATSQQHVPMQNVLETISTQVDPLSKAGKVLSQLSSLQAKYGDSILEKLGHLDKHESINKASDQLSQSQRDVNNRVDQTMASGQHLAQEHLQATSQLINNGTEQIAAAALHAQSASEAAAREMAENTAAAGRETLHNTQVQAERVVESAQAGAERLMDVERRAESVARNIGSNITTDFRGFFGKDDRHYG